MNEPATFDYKWRPSAGAFAAHHPAIARSFQNELRLRCKGSAGATAALDSFQPVWSSLESLEKTVFPFASGRGLKYRWPHIFDGLASS
jgi:hypothetical protein